MQASRPKFIGVAMDIAAIGVAITGIAAIGEAFSIIVNALLNHFEQVRLRRACFC